MCRCSRCATGFIEEECADQPSSFLHSRQLIDLWDQHCLCLQLMLADRQSHAVLHHAYWQMGDTDPLSLLISRGAVTPSSLLHLPFSNHSRLCPQPPSYLIVFLSCFPVRMSFIWYYHYVCGTPSLSSGLWGFQLATACQQRCVCD